MEGQEISEVDFSKLVSVETFRLDSDYFLKKYLQRQRIIELKPDSFTSFKDMQIEVDASAFYPSLEPFYNQGDIPFIRVADVNEFIDYENCIKIPNKIIESDSFKTLRTIAKGDIVITKGGSVGRVALIDRYTAVTRDLIFINSSRLKELDYTFLYLYLLSGFAFDLMIQSSSMTAQPHLTITLIRNLPIFEASTTFKQRTVAIYDKVVSLREKSKTLYSQAEKLLLDELRLKDFEPSQKQDNIKLFSESFLSTGRLDAEYYQKKYDKIEEEINLHTPFRLNDIFQILGSASPSQYTDNGIKVVKTKNVRIPSVDFQSISDHIDITDFLLEEKDLIFASMGVGSLGRVSYIDKLDSQTTIDGTLRVFRTREKYKNQNYEIPTLLFLTSSIGQELIYKYIIGSTGIISISKESIENLSIPLIRKSVRANLTDMVFESIKLKQKSTHLLEVVKCAVEIAIEQNERVAIEYINENMML